MNNVDPSGQRPFGGKPQPTPEPAPTPTTRVLTKGGTGPCGSSKVKYCWGHWYDGGEVRDGAIILGLGLAGFIGFIATFIASDGGVMWVITVLTHGFLNSILHDISGGIERIMEGINGPLSAASRVVFDIVNLVIDAIVFIYDAITVTQGVRNLAKQAGSWEKLFAKFRRLLVRNFNKKFFAALIGDIANALWSVPTIIGDYDNLRHDAREAGYSWVLS